MISIGKFSLLTAFFASLFNLAFSQTILNNSFENWTSTTLFYEPDTFVTTNMQAYMSTGQGNVTRTASSYSGNYAARLETVANSTDTIFGGLFIGSPGPSGIAGGRPYPDRPDSTYGYVNYDIMPGDTAVIMVLFKLSGSVLGASVSKFFGTQTTFTRFVSNVQWFSPLTVQPDSMMVMISSSNLSGSKIPGSYLVIDNIGFSNTIVAPFPFGGLENWSAKTTEEPDNWSTINYANIYDGNYSSTKTTDHYSGNFALQLQNVITMWNDTMGYITNGVMGNNGPSGGQPISQNPDTLTFFYKYAPVGPDPAIAYIATSRFDTILGSSVMVDIGTVMLGAQSNYTKVQIPFTFNGFPPADSICITFCSGNIINQGSWVGLGSILKIDSLHLSFKQTITDLELLIPSGNFDLCVGSTHQNIPILIKNIGSTKVPAGQVIDVYYQIDANPLVWERDSLIADVFPNDTINYTFAHTVNLSALGQHTYKFWFNYSQDTLNINDTTSGIATRLNQIQVSITNGDTLYLSAGNFPDTLRLNGTFNTINWWNSTMSVTGSDSTLIINAYGLYFVDVDNNYGCTARDSILVTMPTSVLSTANIPEFKVFPNPCNGIFKVIANNNSGKNNIVIMDPSGRTIGEKSFSGPSATIDLSGIDKGIYFLKFNSGKDCKFAKLIIQ